MAILSGVLQDGAGCIINNCTIELRAKKTTNRVLTKTQAFIVADNGKYEINVSPCEYDVTLIINGFPPKKLGSIQIFSDSVDGTLNDYLLNPTEEEITPAILQQVFDARNETNKSADRAAESEKKIKISENNVVEASKLARNSADSAKSSEDESFKTATIVKNSVDDAKKYADLTAAGVVRAENSAESASKSADVASQCVADTKKLAQQSADNASVAQTSASAAKQSADNAAKWALSLDTSNFIQSTGAEHQSIDGTLDVKNLTENGERVYSPNHKPTADDVGALSAVKTSVNNVPIYTVGSHVVFTDIIGDWRLMPFRRDELPFGWYFRNGDNYLLSSPQGQALNSLSANYKNDHSITIKTINGLQYINVPTAFAPDGRGFFERPVNGTTRQVGSWESDTIRNITARFGNFLTSSRNASGAFRVDSSANPAYDGNSHGWHTAISLDASLAVPTSHENRPIYMGLTPAIYLGV